MSKFAILGILLEPLMFARADAIGVVSAAIAVAKGLSRSQANKVRVLYNPVNLAQFRPVEARRDSDRKTIVSVGRLTAPKDFATVIRAFALLRAKIAADLIILGEGPDRRALERLARSLDVPVSMPGYAPDAAAIMREADLIIVSSKSEGFANTIVEGWACGTPVIATDCEGAPRELIAGHDETALVPVGDAAAMAEAALATLAAPRDRNALRERAAPFALHLAARRYRNLAATLVAERRASL